MTPLSLKLKTSAGVDVSLRCIAWPDSARMHWVRMVDGAPEMVTATLALAWTTGVTRGSVTASADMSDTTPWDGFDEPSGSSTFMDDEDRLSEWSDTFCAEVNKALEDCAALTPFADLHWHEVEASRTWYRLGYGQLGRRGLTLEDGTEAATVGEESLACHVVNVILEQTGRNSLRRAAAEYERAGGVLEAEPRSGNEAWKPGVPVDVLAAVSHDASCRDCAGTLTVAECNHTYRTPDTNR